jgi:hypothetical protein
MKLQQAYFAGFDRREFTAYNFRLYPLTLGHVQLMAMMGSEIPWQCPNGIRANDLCSAVAVGMFSAWEDAHQHLTTSPDAAEQIGAHMAQHADDKQTESVLEWLVYYLSKPRSIGSYDVMESRCPWWWTYAEFLQSELGKSEESAWATICADAFSYYAAFAGRNGNKQFSTLRECLLEDAVKEGKTMKQLFEEGVI